MDDPALADVLPESALDLALAAGDFRLYRQAIVPLRGGCGGATQYEILVRMGGPDGTVIEPAAFMPDAERRALLTAVERWVIAALVAHLAGLWRAGGVPEELGECGYYAVNLSGASFNDPTFPQFLHDVLARHPLPTRLLGFEITETTAIRDLDRAASLMREFQQLGCRYALDDFGTGLASFEYLRKLPVNAVKIAAPFVQGMVTDAVDAAIVEAIQRVCQVAGLPTIAEGVEDEAALAAVRRLGVDFAQGYYLARPEPLVLDAVDQGR